MVRLGGAQAVLQGTWKLLSALLRVEMVSRTSLFVGRINCSLFFVVVVLPLFFQKQSPVDADISSAFSVTIIGIILPLTGLNYRPVAI